MRAARRPDRKRPRRPRKNAATAALVAFDPLSRYLAEIRRFPLLTREEEIEIAKRYAKPHDPADAYRLVTANLRLVVKIASEFAHASRNLLDLIQEGNVGLMEAVRNFDPYRGIRFPSYAVWWVRAYIYRFLINNWRLVKIGTTQAQRKLFFNLRKETERLEAEGFSAQPLLLAQRMGVKESEVREMQERMAHSEVSLDQPVREDEERQLLDVIPDRGDNPEEATAHDEWRRFAREKDRAVREHAQGQGTRNFPHPAALRGAADAAGDRRAVRYQPRARAPDREAAEKAAQGFPQGTGVRYRTGRPVKRAACSARVPCRVAIMALG